MSWLFAAVYDRYMRASESAFLGGWRAELLAALDGAANILEVGAGSGANVPHYAARTGGLVLAEPDARMRRLLERRVAATPSLGARVTISSAGLPSLPFADASFDVVVATLVLCSVPDLAASLASIARVLRPGGRLVFIEHVGAEAPRVRRQQALVEPVWKWIAEGCHLTRETEAAIVAAGFRFERIVREIRSEGLTVCRPGIRGIARLA